MSRSLIERRLFDLAQRLRAAREELAVLDEQLAALKEAADEARIRSLVSETPLAHREYAEAQRHADVLARSQRRSRTCRPTRIGCSTGSWPATALCDPSLPRPLSQPLAQEQAPWPFVL
jgi:predicted RNA-binding protein